MTAFPWGCRRGPARAWNVRVAAFLVVPVVFFGGIGSSDRAGHPRCCVSSSGPSWRGGDPLSWSGHRKGLLGRKHHPSPGPAGRPDPALRRGDGGAPAASPRGVSFASRPRCMTRRAAGAIPAAGTPGSRPGTSLEGTGQTCLGPGLLRHLGRGVGECRLDGPLITLTVLPAPRGIGPGPAPVLRGQHLVWGPFMPPRAVSFGPFVNRNHFAQWAAMASLLWHRPGPVPIRRRTRDGQADARRPGRRLAWTNYRDPRPGRCGDDDGILASAPRSAGCSAARAGASSWECCWHAAADRPARHGGDRPAAADGLAFLPVGARRRNGPGRRCGPPAGDPLAGSAQQGSPDHDRRTTGWSVPGRGPSARSSCCTAESPTGTASMPTPTMTTSRP